MIDRTEGRKAKGTIARGQTKAPQMIKGNQAARREGVSVDRYFTAAGESPFDRVEWELRTAAITGETGKVYFEQQGCEIPKAWSQTATNVVVQKYFRGLVGTPQRERS